MANRFLNRFATATKPRLAAALVPLGLVCGVVVGRRLMRQRPPPRPLPPALDGTVEHLQLPFGTLAFYHAGPTEGTPLLLIHSVNAAANAYEMKPLFDHYGRRRSVYALDLPGFGLSDRPDRIYTPRLMTDAILSLVEVIRRRHGPFALDAVALSTGCEFLARAASERPTLFRTLGLISPTGLRSDRPGTGAPGSTYGRPALRDILTFPAWSGALFRALISKVSLRFFLARTWGSPAIDRGLLVYDHRSALQPGAQHAPFSFLSGFLFSADIITVYRSLAGPVWMAHGTRGDAADYRRKNDMNGAPNWTVQVFDSGGMIHFERQWQFIEAYDAFLGRVA